MLGLDELARTAWLDLIPDLEGSVLLCDTAALEVAHWTVTIGSLVGEHGVVAVHHVTDHVVQYGEDQSLYFLLGDMDTMHSLQKTVERWLTARTCHVHMTCLFTLPSLRLLSDPAGHVATSLSSIYPHTSFTASSTPLPCMALTPRCLVTPAARRLFPLTSPDLRNLGDWLKTRGDNRSPELGQAVTLNMLPTTLQLQMKVLAEELGGMFDEIGAAEDCYSVGSFSRLVADCLVATAGHRPARKTAPKKLSVVFVDRTLDLFGVSGFQTDSAAELLFNEAEELFPGSNDINVDLRKLFNKPEEEYVVNGCLADSKSAVPISTLLSTTQETLTDEVLGSLEGQLQLDPDTLASRDLAAILPETDTFSKYQHFPHFQILAAIQQCLDNKQNRDLASYLASTDTSLLWTTLEDSVLPGQLANSILAPRQDDLSLAPVHVTSLLTHVYSLFGDMADTDSDSDAIQLAKLKNSFFKLVKKVSADKFSSTLKSACKTDDELFTKVDEVFERLESLASSRSSLTHLSTLTTPDTPNYTPLLSQLTTLCLDSPGDLPGDVEHRSGGLRDLLKTGLGLFTGAVSKPRPACPLLLYVVGGVSAGEVAWVEKYCVRTKQEVFVAGGCLLNRDKLAHMSLLNDNLFGV